MRKPKDTTLPKWFDEAKHAAGDGGVFEIATGTLLGDDGAPLSPAVAMARAGAAALEAAEAEPSPRGTEQILADHINAEAKE